MDIKNVIKMLFIFMWGWGVTACDDMDATYKSFLEGGEIVYPGKPDSLRAYPGEYRIKLTWLADASVTKSKIFWNNRKDSLEVPVEIMQGFDTVSVLLTDMEEGVYTFEIYNYDGKENVSVKEELVGEVFGNKYRNSLKNGIIEDISLDDDNLLVRWVNIDEQSIGVEINYTDKSDSSRELFVPGSEDSILILENFKLPGDIFIRSLFLPDSLAIDTFSTEFSQWSVLVDEIETEVDRSIISLYPLPGDYFEPSTSTNDVSLIWTNPPAINNTCFLTPPNGHPMPQWFTIDLGNEYELSRMKLFQRGDEGSNTNRLYAGGNLREYEVWGSLNPDPDYNPDDHNGDFGDSWILLKTYNVNRPSGNTLPTGKVRDDNTDEDIAAAVAGDELFFNYNGKVRYIRIKAIKNWDADSRPFVQIAAVTFWLNETGIVLEGH